MKKPPKPITPNEAPLTITEFLTNYNKSLPQNFPHASLVLLERFKNEHISLFKTENVWTLDHHRKRLMDWLPQNM